MTRMPRNSHPVPRLLALALACAALGALSCQHRTVFQGDALPAGYSFFLFSERLSACPQPGTQLKSAARAPATPQAPASSIRAGYWSGPYCHGFTKYDYYEGINQGTEPIYARLEFAKTCSVFVAVPVKRLCVGVPLSACPSYQNALVLARRFLKLAGPDLALDANAERTLNATGFENPEVWESWCERRIRAKFDATAAPEFQLTPATETRQNVD